MMMGAEEV